jgi:hypothetical protein
MVHLVLRHLIFPIPADLTGWRNARRSKEQKQSATGKQKSKKVFRFSPRAANGSLNKTQQSRGCAVIRSRLNQ